jgi:hypothetical protein
MAKKGLAVRRGSTGPRSLEGKNRAKLNAVKHGIFAAVVLKSESHEEYLEFLTSLSESLQPVGKLEEILVEKLAVAVWRYRRLLRAEGAEIEKAAADYEPGIGERISTMELANAFWKDRGSIAKAFLSHDEGRLVFDVDTLKELREKVRQEGMDWERDRETLFELCGRTVEAAPANSELASAENSAEKPSSAWEHPWIAEYRTLAQQTEGADRRAKVQAAKQMAEKLTERIEFLQEEVMRAHYRKEQMKGLSTTAALVPTDKTDHLLRYEGTLERVFDRALSQLERLQRMRLGHSVPPPVRVELAG